MPQRRIASPRPVEVLDRHAANMGLAPDQIGLDESQKQMLAPIVNLLRTNARVSRGVVEKMLQDELNSLQDANQQSLLIAGAASVQAYLDQREQSLDPGQITRAQNPLDNEYTAAGFSHLIMQLGNTVGQGITALLSCNDLSNQLQAAHDTVLQQRQTLRDNNADMHNSNQAILTARGCSPMLLATDQKRNYRNTIGSPADALAAQGYTPAQSKAIRKQSVRTVTSEAYGANTRSRQRFQKMALDNHPNDDAAQSEQRMKNISSLANTQWNFARPTMERRIKDAILPAEQ